MLDWRDVAKNFDAVVARLADRGGNLDLTPFRTQFAERGKLIIDAETLAGQRNKAN